MIKILWLTNIPSPYRVDFFNELGKSCDLTVLFEKIGSDERDDSWLEFNTENYKAIFLKGKKMGVAEAFCPSVIGWLRKDFDHIVVSNFSDFTGMLAIIWLKLHKKSYELESDGGFPGSGKGIKEKIKKFFISGAQSYFSTAYMHDEYYLMYGAKEEKIIRYPFTSIKQADILPVLPTIDERKTLKEILAIKEEKSIIVVGDFLYANKNRKVYDLLFAIAEHITDSVGIYIVNNMGNEIIQELATIIKSKKEKIRNIHLVEQQESLFKWYRASDLCIYLPISKSDKILINEVMANGLPIITIDKTNTNLEMIKDGMDGCVNELDNTTYIEEKILDILTDKDLYTRMSNTSLDIAAKFMMKDREKYLLDEGRKCERQWLKLFYRKKLGISEDKVVLAVGQFIPRKGFDVLIEASKKLDSKIGIYIIGGEPTEEYISMVETNNLKNIHFLGFKKKEILEYYYTAADILVHPTREDIWGLVINEAMAKGLPVITTNRCIAGLELISTPLLGRIVPSEDVEELSWAIEEILNSDKDEEMHTAILDKISGYTYQTMAQCHLEVWKRSIKV